MFFMNSRFSKESPGTSHESRKNQKFMENIGQANVFHEFVVFQRISWDQPGIQEKPKVHGKHWPGQCFPMFFQGNSWKTLAWPMFDGFPNNLLRWHWEKLSSKTFSYDCWLKMVGKLSSTTLLKEFLVLKTLRL